jgi:hypothetical protein
MSRRTYQTVQRCSAGAHSTFRKYLRHRNADHRGIQNAPNQHFFSTLLRLAPWRRCGPD